MSKKQSENINHEASTKEMIQAIFKNGDRLNAFTKIQNQLYVPGRQLNIIGMTYREKFRFICNLQHYIETKLQSGVEKKKGVFASSVDEPSKVSAAFWLIRVTRGQIPIKEEDYEFHKSALKTSKLAKIAVEILPTIEKALGTSTPEYKSRYKGVIEDEQSIQINPLLKR